MFSPAPTTLPVLGGRWKGRSQFGHEGRPPDMTCPNSTSDADPRRSNGTIRARDTAFSCPATARPTSTAGRRCWLRSASIRCSPGRRSPARPCRAGAGPRSRRFLPSTCPPRRPARRLPQPRKATDPWPPFPVPVKFLQSGAWLRLRGAGRRQPELYIHADVLRRSGMTGLAPGQRVGVRAENVPRGLQATDIEPL